MVTKSTFSPRIAIYGSGFVGSCLTRLVVDKGWKIVSAYNRAGSKIGQDSGQLAGLDRNLDIPIQDRNSSLSFNKIENSLTESDAL